VVGSTTKKKYGEELEQRNLPVLKHVREFNRLSRYVTEEIDLEAIRQKRFMKKIQTTLKMQLRIVRAKEFQELLDSVHASDEKDNKEIYGKRKRVQVENRQVLDSQLILNSSFQHGNQSEEVATTKVHHAPKKSRICSNCGKKGHIKKECRKPKGLCCGCGERGHKMMNCPNQQLIQRPPAERSQAFTRIIPPSDGNDEGTSTGKSSGKLHGKRKAKGINQDEETIGTSKSNLIPHLSCS
jgi:hypothetical protein